MISDLLNSYANNFTLPRYKVYFYGTYETATLKSEGTFLTYLFTCTKILQGHLWTTGNNILISVGLVVMYAGAEVL